MTRMNIFAGVCATVLAAGSTGCALLRGTETEPVERVSLAGNWILNVAESSDTARASVRTLHRDAPPASDAGRAAPRPGTYGERLRRAHVDDELAARVLAAARSQIEQLSIADSAGVITLHTGEHDPVVLTPDGRTARRKWLDGTTAELRARWVQRRLEIVRRLDGAITVQEYYSRSPGGSRLAVFTIVQGPFEGEITVRRVYERS